MAISTLAANALTDRLPNVIDAKQHAVLDYLVAGTFFTMGVLFWKDHKRAAFSALFCGGAVAATSLLTDYPGGVTDVLSFETHGRIDTGIAAITAAIPTVLSFGEDPESKYFRAMALAETVVTGLTDYERHTSKVVEMQRRA